MKVVYHILSLLLLLQGVTGRFRFRDHAGQENDDNRRLTQGCYGECQANGRQTRHTCFDYCNTNHPNDGGTTEWQANRKACKDVCRDIYRTKYNVCKAHCTSTGDSLLTENEKDLCSNCPCCSQGESFRNTLQDPDVCIRRSEGGRHFYTEDVNLYRCELLGHDDGDASAPRYYTVAKISFEDNFGDYFSWCQDNDHVNELQHGQTEQFTPAPPETPSQEWHACEDLFSSLRSRAFPNNCEYVDPYNFNDVEDITEYCKHVLMV